MRRICVVSGPLPRLSPYRLAPVHLALGGGNFLSWLAPTVGRPPSPDIPRIFGSFKMASVSIIISGTGIRGPIVMLICTVEKIGRDYEVLGIVKGSTIQSKNIGRDIGQGLKSIVGGELVDYTKMMNDARKLAEDRMVEEAQKLGADAVVCARYATSSVMQGAAEVIAYGTAVRYV